MLTFDFRKPNFDRPYIHVIWILEKWMQIHAREVGINQDGQNGKKSKYWLLTWKVNWPFYPWTKLVEKSNILLDNPTNS